MTYTGKVIPLDLGIEEITTSGIGLVFSEATAFHFMKNNKIHYSVQIRPKRIKKTSNNIIVIEPSAPPSYLVNEIITDNDSSEFQNVNSNNDEYTITNEEQSEDYPASSAAGLITARKWNV